jgi:hypothetical protein
MNGIRFYNYCNPHCNPIVYLLLMSDIYTQYKKY